MGQVHFHTIGDVCDSKLEFGVIVAEFKDKWIFVRHRERDTWEIPGGHREKDENIDHTASRELFEETGAKKFIITPICDYSVTINNNTRFGRLFCSEIKELGELPNLEIEEIKLFNVLPENLTYPNIQKYLYEKVLLWKRQCE
ncbi:NUDIX hydrolase [Tepidibacter hydrothermalis]|uniref:NUDIX domain-containing protein n=1 Tax=Tepidibacter hydrothermalis TaxID=3036126 RepID=A0ABY8EEL2_9FIRM|nr:NUDIX domain-containing protein [Tepidibacter hydrothermalis]WFD11376.1 NUDIX domain-containing protein [Tepidibacter hydrothermalis]